MKYTGGCRCGKIRYEAHSDGPRSVVCGCPDCQRSSGSFVSIAIGIMPDQFTITSGADTLKSYQDTGESGQPVHRYFCSHCGSQLYARPDSYPVVSLRAASLDEPFHNEPAFAIFVERIPDWIGLPKHVVDAGLEFE